MVKAEHRRSPQKKDPYLAALFFMGKPFGGETPKQDCKKYYGEISNGDEVRREIDTLKTLSIFESNNHAAAIGTLITVT